jgi:hypothetical protein
MVPYKENVTVFDTLNKPNQTPIHQLTTLLAAAIRKLSHPSRRPKRDDRDLKQKLIRKV